MKNIYCISGLGADEGAFSRLKIEGYQLVYLPWLLPQKKESIRDYAQRMSEGIKEDNPIIMGLSFGGMMAIEIAKLLPVAKIILISSIRTAEELPRWMKRIALLNLNKIFPMRSRKIFEPVQNRFLGITNNSEEIMMVRNYRKNAPIIYTTWAINEVVNWRNDFLHPSIFHIHGDNDKMFPIKNLSPSYIVNGGGHFMIMNKAEEISAYVNSIL